MDILYERFQVQNIRSWDTIQGRGDKGNVINGLPECVLNTALGSRGGGKLLVACILRQRGSIIVEGGSRWSNRRC